VVGAPPPPPPRAPPQPLRVKPAGAYMAGVDLPSSEESEEEREKVVRSVRGITLERTGKEEAKARKKDMLVAQRVAQMKEAAVQDDTDAFTVRLAKNADVADAALQNSRDVKVDGLSVSARGKVLLENTSFTIVAGRRYGLVGPNGKGKSTLLKLLGWRKIPVPDYIDVLMVEQEVTGDDTPALQAVVAADAELMTLRAEESALRIQLDAAAERAEQVSGGDAAKHDVDEDATEEATDAASARLAAVYERLAEMGAGGAESRAAKILAGLGFTEAMQGRPTHSFSGGWRMRISLARALYIQPTLLLLDEPTNHLDLRAVLWLEEYLQRWKKTLVVVSHDREFLNTVCTDIIHLHDLKLATYRGNFAQFEDMYEQRRKEANKAFDKYEKQLKAAKASSSKAKIDKVQAGAKAKLDRKARAGQAADDEDDEDKADAPRKWADYTVSFAFPTPSELPPPLLSLMDVSFKYPNRDDFGLQDINLGVDMGTRVAIVGPNGAGKSTLLNLLAGDLQPSVGEQRRSHKLRVGRYSQHFVDVLQMDENPVEYLLRLHPTAGLKPEGMRALLGRFGLEGHNHLSPILKLSGGQKARVVFASIALLGPHILLMDEPTNHLDMQSIDALAEALEAFEGGVVLVSHDARLISTVCEDETKSQIWVVDHGQVEFYQGDFEAFRRELIDEIKHELDE